MMSPIIFILKATQPQSLDQMVQVNVLIRTSKLNFKNVTSKRAHIKITSLRVHCLVLIHRNMSLRPNAAKVLFVN